MPWSTKAHRETPVLEVTMAGWISFDELSEARKAARSLGAGLRRSLLLLDCSGLEGGPSVADLAAHAEEVAWTSGHHFSKEAMIVPRDPAAAQNAVFWRDAATNRGIRVHLFADRASAMNWLAER